MSASKAVAESESCSSSIPVGVIGFGKAAKTFHLPLLFTTPGFEVVSICTSKTSEAQEFCKAEGQPEPVVFTDPEELIRAQEPATAVIVIASPTGTHFELAAEAIKANKHVVVDKPVALTAERATELKKLAELHKVLLTVFHNRRWDCDFLLMKELVERGDLGQPLIMKNNFDRFRPKIVERWREIGTSDQGAGLWYDIGSHLVDQTVQMFGPPTSIFADIAALRDNAETRGAADDYFNCLLRYSNTEGIRRVTLTGSMLGACDRRFTLFGTKGSYLAAHMDKQEEWLMNGARPSKETGEWEEKYDGSSIVRIAENKQHVLRRAGDYGQFYRRVHKAISANDPKQLPVDIESVITVCKIIDMGLESARKGVELPFQP